VLVWLTPPSLVLFLAHAAAASAAVADAIAAEEVRLKRRG
jgi:hypothetical protein